MDAAAGNGAPSAPFHALDMPSTREPSRRSQIGLDWLNFFLADVQTGFGPFVSLFLTANGWGQGAIGSVLTANSVLSLATLPVAGALIDWTRRKRLIVAACLALTAAGALLMALAPRFWAVAAGEAMHGIAGGTVKTAVAAIALGLVSHRAYHTRVGRNQRYDSFGNAMTAAGMGALGALVALSAPLYAAAALCVPAALALFLIHGGDIDYARARSSEGRKEAGAAGWTQLARNRRLLAFAACLFLFHLSDASTLPLASERLASAGRHESELVTALLVVVPQVVTGAIAGWTARRADDWGRRRLLLIGFAALPIRAGLFAVTASPWYLVAVQALGGVTAAVIGIAAPLVVADVTRRSGRYNVALGTTDMVGAVGAAISTAASGFLAQTMGFLPAFAALAVVGLLGLGLVAWQVPETAHEARRED
jgi:MFS family permease